MAQRPRHGGAAARKRRTMKRQTEPPKLTLAPEALPEDAALASITEIFQNSTGCSCGHGVSEHIGADGPCKHEDGRGICSCGGYAEAELAAKAEELAEASGLVAAADIVWGPEQGFNDLMCDLNAALNPGDSWVWCVLDISLDLTRCLLAQWEKNEYWIAGLTVTDGEPVLAPSSDWVKAESAWVEANEKYVARHASAANRPGGTLTNDDGATVRLTFPPEAVDAAATALLKGAVVNGEATPESEGFAATVAERLGRFVMTFDSVTLPEEHQPAETLPEANPSPAAPAAMPTGTGEYAWSAIITLEGTMTDDGRAFAPDALTWRDLPLTLGAMLDTPHADMVTKAEACGRIDRIWRAGNEVRASGVFDSGDYGQKIAQMVADGTVRGVSVDTAVKEYEFGPESDYFDADGHWIPQGAETAEEETETPDLLDVLFGGTEEDTILVITAGVIGAVTVCPFAAFADARIEIASSLVAGASKVLWTSTRQAGWIVVRTDAPEALTASAEPPLRPPAEWFNDPELDGPTPLTVDENGRVFGHAWAWGTCHIGIPGVCTTAPRSQHGYSYFHLGEIECDDGSRVTCGKVTLDAPHAGQRLGRAAASAHYDHTGLAVADVRIGEDEHGGWVAGALRTDVPDVKLRAFRAASLSGDWRDVNGNLELVALLCVNVPGFPVPRARALVASAVDGTQRVLSLTAAGQVAAAGVVPARAEVTLAPEDAALIAALGDDAAGLYDELAASAQA